MARTQGTVKWFNGDKGYGFITQEVAGCSFITRNPVQRFPFAERRRQGRIRSDGW
jgi:hypothetical protein